jgi:diguanylate cyclase (GGDEF)-like protein
MSLRLKTILGIGFIEAVLLLILITSILEYMRTSNEESMENYVLTTTQLFAATTKDAVLSFDLASLETFVEEILKNQGLLYVRIMDTNKNILATGGDKHYLAKIFSADTNYQHVTDDVYDTVTAITVDGQTYGYIEMGISTERITRALAKAQKLAATIAIVEMGLVALFSFMLGVYLTKQLKVLRSSAKAIAAGDLDHAIDIKTHDEIGEVAASFNKMIVSLNASKKETEQYQGELLVLNKNLEERVEKRTWKILEQKQKLDSAYNDLSYAQKKINNLASFDQLTGYPNREQFLLLLEKRISRMPKHATGTVILLAIDHFKRINDSINSDNADTLLIEVGNRISHCVGVDDIIARPGGDVFLLVLSQEHMMDKDSRGTALSISDTLLHEISLPFNINDHILHITTSIGVALFDQSMNAKMVLHHVEYASNYSKINGRNKSSCFEEKMQAAVNKRFKLEQDLREAVENSELFLAFQPQIRSDDAGGISCNSLEVLVRWIHPQDGFIPPDVFIEIAEESQLIITLGNWIMDHACQQISAWQQEGIPFEHVAINISPIQFKQSDFVETVIDILGRNQLEPNAIMLEITEGVIIDNPDDIIDKIACLKQHGIKISIDDFGTGYSSLGYLKRLPIDELKIDRSFIQEIESDYSDMVITEVIISMAKHFGYEVIAEGVETEAQKDILISKGCDFFQGYYFSRPLPAAEIPPYLMSIQPQRYDQHLLEIYKKVDDESPSIR